MIGLYVLCAVQVRYCCEPIQKRSITMAIRVALKFRIVKADALPQINARISARSIYALMWLLEVESRTLGTR